MKKKSLSILLAIAILAGAGSVTPVMAAEVETEETEIIFDETETMEEASDAETVYAHSIPVLYIGATDPKYIRIGWSTPEAEEGIEYYRIFRRDVSADSTDTSWKTLATQLSAQAQGLYIEEYYDDTTVQNGRVYEYTVRVMKKDESGQYVYDSDYDHNGCRVVYYNTTQSFVANGYSGEMWSMNGGKELYLHALLGPIELASFDKTDDAKLLTGFGCYRTTVTSIELSNDITGVGDGYFKDFIDVNNLKLSDNITKIGKEAFAYLGNFNTSGMHINWPSALKSIDEQAFYCSKINNADIPNGVETIGKWAFWFCDSLESVTWPEKVTVIPNGCFGATKSLKTFDMPDSVITIDEAAFRSSGIANINLSAGLELIGKEAFSHSGLEDITIPASVNTIQNEAFSSCSSLSKITFEGDIPSIAEDAFLEDTATVYYPAENPTYTEETMLNYGGNLTWVAVSKAVYEPEIEYYHNDDIYMPEYDSWDYRFADSDCIEFVVWDYDVPEGVASPDVEFFSSNTDIISNPYEGGKHFYLGEKYGPVTITAKWDETEYYKAGSIDMQFYRAFCEMASDGTGVCAGMPTKANEISLWSMKNANGDKAVLSAQYIADYCEKQSPILQASAIDAINISSMGKIKDNTFSSCQNIKSISFWSHVDLEDNAFAGLNNVTVHFRLSDGWKASELNNHGGTNIKWVNDTVISMEDCEVTVANDVFESKKGPIDLSVTVTYGDYVLIPGVDYNLRCDDLMIGSNEYPLHVGECEFEIEGKGNFTGSYVGKYTILPAESQMTAAVGSKTMYCGKSQKITVKDCAGELTFESSNASIAAVDADGMITTFNKAGTVTISVTDSGRVSFFRDEPQIDSKTVTIKITVSKLPTPAVPTLSNGAAGVTVKWTAVSNADKYRVFRKETDGSFKKLADTTALSYTDKTAVSGTEYQYSIACVSADGKYKTSNNDAAGSTITYLSVPQLSACTSSGSSIKVHWGTVPGATYYQVYRKLSGETSWTKIAKVTGASAVTYEDTTAAVGKTYYYTVRAYKTSSVSGTYDKTGKSAILLAAPELSSVANAASGVTFKWKSVSGAAGYYVYRKASGESSWTKIKEITSGSTVSFTDKDVTSGKTYKYTVKAYKTSKMYGSYNKTGLTIKYLKQPTVSVTAGSKEGTVKVSWSAVTGATGYNLYRKVPGGSWKKKVLSGTATSVELTCSGGEELLYSVQAVSGTTTQYVSSYDKTGKTYVYVPTPTSLKVTAGNLYRKLSWGASANAAGYDIYYKTSSTGKWKVLKSGVTSTSYKDKLNQTTKYIYYTVKAYYIDKNGVKWESGEAARVFAEQYVDNPEIKSLTDNGEYVSFKWAAVENAISYTVYRYEYISESGTWGMCTLIKTTTGTSIKDKTAKSFTKYKYIVKSNWNVGVTPGSSRTITTGLIINEKTTLYWATLKSDPTFHIDCNCSALSKKTVVSGTKSEAESNGKVNACPKCCK